MSFRNANRLRENSRLPSPLGATTWAKMAHSARKLCSRAGGAERNRTTRGSKLEGDWLEILSKPTRSHERRFLCKGVFLSSMQMQSAALNLVWDLEGICLFGLHINVNQGI